MKPLDKREQKERGVRRVINAEEIYTAVELKQIGNGEWVWGEHKIDIKNNDNNTKT